MDITLVYKMLPYSARDKGLNTALFREPMAIQNQYKSKKKKFLSCFSASTICWSGGNLVVHFSDASK